ncbi:hypothetical protein JXM67_11420 [candidate division WOR-3 bacterium]|nr:hypothetical protein [candidate division WOR-3 bacterium]
MKDIVSRLLAVVILIAASGAGARVVREKPLIGFYRTKARADSVINEFYRVWNVFHYHLFKYHDTVKALMLADPDYPEMPAGFYERNDIHWIRLGWDLDSLYALLEVLQADFNLHLGEFHFEADTSEWVCELPTASWNMTEEELAEYRISEYAVMIAYLGRELDDHLISIHFDTVAPPAEFFAVPGLLSVMRS